MRTTAGDYQRLQLPTTTYFSCFQNSCVYIAQEVPTPRQPNNEEQIFSSRKKKERSNHHHEDDEEEDTASSPPLSIGPRGQEARGRGSSRCCTHIQRSQRP
jgi:hypothetical protein